MASTKVWTLDDLHSLPDDGNKYELINGELYVTPAPTNHHEPIGARLARLLDRYAEAENLGFVYRPRAIFRWRGSEVEPDLMVRAPWEGEAASWDNAPHPILVVEIGSPSSWWRDRTVKRDHYRDAVLPDGP
jgi:Uma2 family endonuclease